LKLYKTYKFKLKPNKAQEETFESWVNICRKIYNVALEERIWAYKTLGKSISKFDQHNQLPEIKKSFPYVGEVYSNTLQEVLDRLDKAYKSFFKGTGFPKFAKKGKYNSFTYKSRFTVKEKTIKLPKIGEVKYFNSQPILGKPKTATIIKENNGWFICIVSEYETEFNQVVVDNQNPIGLDCGVTRFLALSNGTFIDSPNFLQKESNKLRLLQRKLSRQVKGSKSRDKTKQQIRKLHKKISNRRLDFLHKTSTNLSNNFSAIYMEDLNLQIMQEKGFKEVNKGMLDNGFYTFKVLLGYKMVERGKHLGLVNPAYTSQTCFSCGNVDKQSRISQSEYVCVKCGYISNADTMASKNILSKGIAQVTKVQPLG